MGDIKVRVSGSFVSASKVNVKKESGWDAVKSIYARSGDSWVKAWDSVPDTPVLTATNYNAYTNNLSWTASTSAHAITSYTLETSLTGSSWSQIYNGSSTSYTHTSLTQNTLYYYRVRANTAINSSLNSATQNATTRTAALRVETITSTGTFAKPIGVTSLDYMVIGGGGNAGNCKFEFISPSKYYRAGGGGGAGAVNILTGVSVSSSALSMAVTVGFAGQSSSFNGTTSAGGGRGSGFYIVDPPTNYAPEVGSNGASGGGGGGASKGNTGSGASASGGGSATAGYAGGSGSGAPYLDADPNGTVLNKGGGGGGYSAAGSGGGFTSTPHPGGAGLVSSFDGTSKTYAKGGTGGICIKSSTASKADGTSAVSTEYGSGGNAGSITGDNLSTVIAGGGSGARGVVIVKYYD